MSKPATIMSINRANQFNVLQAGTRNAYKCKDSKTGFFIASIVGSPQCRQALKHSNANSLTFVPVQMSVLKFTLISRLFWGHFYSTLIFPVYLAASTASYCDQGVYSAILDRKTEGVGRKEDGVGEKEQERELKQISCVLSLLGKEIPSSYMFKSYP